MRSLHISPAASVAAILLSTLPARGLAADILQTNGFSNCMSNPQIQVQKLNIQYNKETNKIDFDVAGTNEKSQNVTASIVVTAYGSSVYQKDFNPCDASTFVAQLCPVPAGNFSAQGSQDIPAQYASLIPAVAFSVPNLDGQAELQLKSLDTGQDLACLTSTVDNGKTAAVPAVSYVAVGIAGAALLMSGLSALASGASAGSAQPSPTFSEVIGWFQSMAMNGMLSVSYPAVYQSFATNFGFSGGLIDIDSFEQAIDNFRAATGGNLTNNSFSFLRNNATLVYGTPANNNTKRDVGALFSNFLLYARQITTSVNGTSSTIGNGGNGNAPAANDRTMHYVQGIQAYVEQLTIPQANTFMTVLLVFAVIIAAIIVGILLFKVILETWALFATFPKRLTSFRKRYWWVIAKTIINLILILYGVWTLYCVYQFKEGDSWAAKALAAVTFAAFTSILAFFTFRIWQLARRYKKAEGDASALFEDKETWRKYSLFYGEYKRRYWWLFAPAILYMFAKGCVIAGADGHGMYQTAGQLVIESLMLALLLLSRPYTLKSGNWINVIIQVVRVLSVVCILVFVEELGVAQSTKTITGVVLIVMQSVLTGVLAVLIAVNALVVCVKENPHRRRRKAAEKLNRDDNLTPLDAHNSLLLTPTAYDGARGYAGSEYSLPMVSKSSRGYGPLAPREYSPPRRPQFSNRAGSRDGLVSSAASMGRRREGSGSPPLSRQPTLRREPTLPDLEREYGKAY